MKSAIFKFMAGEWHKHTDYNHCDCAAAQLVLCFASKKKLLSADVYGLLRKKFPAAQVALCSTAGEIFHDTVHDHSLVAVAMMLEKTSIASAVVNRKDYNNSYDAAIALVKKLPRQQLAYILVLSDGSVVNGSELTRGLSDASAKGVLVTGGLAGDGIDFNTTLVGLNQPAAEGNIVAIGFYGPDIIVTHGSSGGWQTFGLEKEVTRSRGNVLYEVDHRSALDLYKKYLGKDADKLPGSALFFPLSLIVPGSKQPVVRTILSIDHEQHSMTFAGDIPEGSKVRFMKANFDMLTSAASVAAQNTLLNGTTKPAFCLLISCVGRKIILDARTEEEVEAVMEVIGDKTPVAGFYSYGEISPFNEGGACLLHNQTMTITSFYELA